MQPLSQPRPVYRGIRARWKPGRSKPAAAGTYQPVAVHRYSQFWPHDTLNRRKQCLIEQRHFVLAEARCRELRPRYKSTMRAEAGRGLQIRSLRDMHRGANFSLSNARFQNSFPATLLLMPCSGRFGSRATPAYQTGQTFWEKCEWVIVRQYHWALKPMTYCISLTAGRIALQSTCAVNTGAGVLQLSCMTRYPQIRLRSDGVQRISASCFARQAFLA